jgi:uncharacterized protein YkwD
MALAWPLIGALVLALAATASSAQRTAPAARPAVAVAVSPTAPAPEFEGQFVSRINSLRASKGLSQLQVSGQLQGVARNWTEQMVRNGQISHNPNLGSQVSGNWTKLGENVGVGYDVDGLMQAFINSPAHYKNLVDPDWNYVGVGVTIAGDGRMYTTHNFMAMPSSAPKPPPSSTPTTAKPRPSGSTTPPPPPSPTTTTTAPPPPPQPHPNEARVTAVLDPLRSLERG